MEEQFVGGLIEKFEKEEQKQIAQNILTSILYDQRNVRNSYTKLAIEKKM